MEQAEVFPVRPDAVSEGEQGELLTYEAEAEEVTSDDVVNRVLNSIEVP